jgi:cell division protein FtsQ
VRSRSRQSSPVPATDVTATSPVLDPATARTRRRFARRQWRRRWLAWRRVLVLLLVALLVVGGVWAVWFSTWLAVDTVEVNGAQTVTAEEIRARADIETGQQLVRVDVAEAEARVRSLAVVKTVEVTRQWPDRVLVTIEERVAIAVVDIGGRLRGMDAEGVVFADYKRPPPGLPRVETSIGTTSEALREAAKVISALPESLTALVEHLQVETVDQISLVLRDGRVVIWGSSADSETKAEVLEELLKTPAQVYDVSVPSRPTTSP